MDLLKKELERKRKTIELAKKSIIDGVDSSSNGKRAYMKAGDLRKIREEQEEERKKEKSNRYEKYQRKTREGVQTYCQGSI